MYYDSEFDFHAHKHLQLSGDLRHDLERNDLVLHYQPKIDLQSNLIVGTEALIRGYQLIRGLLRPDEFILLVGCADLSRPITDWVIEIAALQSQAYFEAGLLQGLKSEIRQILNLSMM